MLGWVSNGGRTADKLREAEEGRERGRERGVKVDGQSFLPFPPSLPPSLPPSVRPSLPPLLPVKESKADEPLTRRRLKYEGGHKTRREGRKAGRTYLPSPFPCSRQRRTSRRRTPETWAPNTPVYTCASSMTTYLGGREGGGEGKWLTRKE